MADIISGDDIAELMEAFARFDTDNDGLINTIELRHVLHYLGQNPTDAELQEQRDAQVAAMQVVGTFWRGGEINSGCTASSDGVVNINSRA